MLVLAQPVGEAGCGQPAGKPRIIGVFPSAWRLHGKLLRPSVARWEKGLDEQAGYFLNALGRSLSASVWRQAVRGYGIALEQGAVIEVLVDLAKAFDHVDRGDGWAKAVGAKYPVAVLYATIVACRWERRLEHGKLSLQLP